MAATPESLQEEEAAALYTAIENGTSDEDILAMIERYPALATCLLWTMPKHITNLSWVDCGGGLHCSVCYHRDSLVDSLLERYPIDINQATKISGMSALHHASLHNATSVVELLLSKGADINFPDNFWMSALHRASEKNATSVVELLLSKGADIHFVDNSGKSALHHAIEKNATSVAEVLLSKGANVHLIDNFGMSALHHAIEKNATSVVELLLSKGADIHFVYKSGKSALHHASLHNATSVVELLLHKGANIHLADIFGMSALHHASLHDATSVVELLLSKGADIHFVDKSGMSALHHASLHNATSVVELLLGKGADIHFVDNSGMSALHHASLYKATSVVELLLSKGADIHFVDNHGRSALHHASQGDATSVVELLLSKGANIHLVDKDGRSALHYASKHNATSIVELLLSKGANIHLVDKDGNTPLHSAAAAKFASWSKEDSFNVIASALEEYGVNPLAKNKEGKTAREVVAEGEEFKHPILRVIEANYLLQGVAKVKAKRVRVSVLGDAAVGKSELISTLSSPDAKGCPSTPPKEGSEEYYAQRTPGVAISELTSSELEAILHFMDYAGQPEFLAGHSPLMVTSYGLYVLVLNLLRGLEQILQSARKWLRFIVSKRDPSLVPDSTPPRLYAVFSYEDKLSSSESRALAKRVYLLMKKEFREYFTWMVREPFVVNCQKGSREMDRLLKALYIGHSEVTKEMPCEPVINDKIRQAIEDWKGEEMRKVQAKTGYHPDLVLSLDRYHAFLTENVSLEVTEGNEEALEGSLELLDLQGDVLVIKAVFDDDCQELAFQDGWMSIAGEQCQPTTDSKEHPLTTFVVLDPAWFCRDVLKVVLSPPEFPCVEIMFPDHGVCEEVEIDDALQSVKINPAIGKAFLETSNICGRNVPRYNEFFCPYHLRAEAPSESWKKDDRNPPQGGILLYCRSSPASPVLMAHLQLAFCKHSGGVSEHTCIWKKGLVFQWTGFVTIKMEQLDGEHDVSLTARAEAGELTQCATALSDISHIAMATARVVTPGSCMEVLYLSPTEVGDYAPPSKAYKAEEVIECSKTQTKLQRGALTDDPRAILPVVQACRPDLFRDHGPRQLTRYVEKERRPSGGPTLLEIAELLPKRDDCLELSQVVGASKATRAKVESRNPSVWSCNDAFDMLLSWWRERPAHGGRVLHDALREVGRADLADKFKDKLLSLPDVCGEHAYIVSPTDFGKVLHDVSLLLASRLHALKVGYELCASASAMAIVEDVEEACYHRGCAKQMLKQWWSEQSGNDVGAQLYRALVNAGRKDIAESFEQQLFQGYRDD